MNKIFDTIMTFVCRHSYRRPSLFILLALLVTIPSVLQLDRIGLDTDLIRLLPDSSHVVRVKKQVENIVTGSGGFFAVLIESPDRQSLLKAFQASLEEISKLKGVGFLEYRNSRDFYDKYRYLLIPSEDLDRIYEFLIRQEAKLSPVGEDLLGEEKAGEEKVEDEGEEEIKHLIRYIDLPEYHQSEDGRIMGIKVFPEKGTTNFGKTRELFFQLKNIAKNVSEENNVWTGVGGSLRNDLDQYDFTLSDLSRSGLITLILVLLALAVGFRNLGAIPVILVPLAFGLIWTLGSIPMLVGDLNTITSFLLLVSFGLGIDFSIHLVKRFQFELLKNSPQEALLMTFRSTGKSIFVSGLTTALALYILAFSGFRGFSEFGLIGGSSIIIVLAATLFILPSITALAFKYRIIKKRSQWKSRLRPPGKLISFALLSVILAALVFGVAGLTFNYDFSKMEADIPQAEGLKDRYYEVYETARSPGALFIARSEKVLDELLSELENRMADDSNTRILRFYSIRELSPSESETRKRLSLIEEIKDTVAGKWIRRVEDPDHKKFIDDITDWIPPDHRPDFNDLPETLKNRVISESHPGNYIVPVYIKGEKQKGRNAIAFTQELNELDVSDEVIGPFGETPVLASILQIVTTEGPWLVAFAFLGIFLLILFNQGSLLEAIWIMIPLITGLVLTAGIMALIGLKLNFFNIVVFPTLVGIGIDDGVHYFRRWKENQKDTGPTQKELFIPLSLTTATTMFAYVGIAFSRHPGLGSIGVLACVGLGCTWLTTLFLLPGLLNMFYKKHRPNRSL